MWMEKGQAAFPLGTENMGRDMLAQLIVGTPSSLKVGFIASSIGMGVGLILGSVYGLWPSQPPELGYLVAAVAFAAGFAVALVLSRTPEPAA